MSSPLFIDDQDRYSRLRLIAWWDQEKIKNAKVLVVGAGALGNEVLKNLALLGIGHTYIVDFDHVDDTNLSRTVLFRRRDVGRPKAIVAAEAAADLNPDCKFIPIQKNVVYEVGLGLFRDVDVVIGCLDNREARLWVNRYCWRTNTPWVDGGIQEINGVVKVFIPPGDACYECAMTENDYHLINLRYSCPLLRREDIMAGKVPTAPTISSVIAGLQTQEALKLIHEMPVQGGEAFVFNGLTNRSYNTRFQRKEECLSHETDPEPTDVDLGIEVRVKDLFDLVRERHPGNEPLRLDLDRDLVTSLHCAGCDHRQRVFRPLQSVGMNEAECPHCKQTLRPELVHTIYQGDPIEVETLRDIGVPPYDCLRIRVGEMPTTWRLTADRASVMGE
jgi:molybdopterin/thiamine biosynthesis adenylyltransferase